MFGPYVMLHTRLNVGNLNPIADVSYPKQLKEGKMAYADRTGDVHRVTMAMRFKNGQVQMPSFNLQITQAAGGDNRDLLGNQVNSLIVTHILPLTSTEDTYLGCRIAPTYTTPPYAPKITRISQAGAAAPQAFPTQVRPVIKLYTEMVGPFYRGRIYGFTPDTGMLDTVGGVSLTLLNAWVAALDVFRAGLITGGTSWQMCLVHRKKKADGTVYPVTPITRIEVSDKWGTIRRSGMYSRVNDDPW
jgi:hypothetical protein